jgi:hypothetical protein
LSSLMGMPMVDVSFPIMGGRWACAR